MQIYIDSLRAYAKKPSGKLFAHCVVLHGTKAEHVAFASAIALNGCFYHSKPFPHLDVSQDYYAAALAAGAILTTSRELIRLTKGTKNLMVVNTALANQQMQTMFDERNCLDQGISDEHKTAEQLKADRALVNTWNEIFAKWTKVEFGSVSYDVCGLHQSTESTPDYQVPPFKLSVEYSPRDDKGEYLDGSIMRFDLFVSEEFAASITANVANAYSEWAETKQLSV